MNRKKILKYSQLILISLVACTSTSKESGGGEKPASVGTDKSPDKTPGKSAAKAADFGDRSGCVVVRDLESGKTVYESTSALCQERLYACSTFKIPLAVMAFDQGILIDENTKFKWDGKPQIIKAWEHDATARSWLKDSVVWYSQRITPKLGLKKIQSYLSYFKYGNQDFSGGIEKAWLSSTLKVSAEEQVDMLARFKKHDVKVRPAAIDKTLAIIPNEVDDSNFKVSGKTGSCFSWEDEKSTAAPPYRVGWYVGYTEKNSKSYAFAVVFKDKTEKGTRNFGGAEAKKIAVDFLRKGI